MLKNCLEKLGLVGVKNIYHNLTVTELVEKALLNGEGNLVSNGALNVITGKYTGRSPNDRFIVDQESLKGRVNWGKVNVPMGEEVFDGLYKRLLAYLQNKDIYIFDGVCGADRRHSKSVRFINELASQNLFVHQLFIRPTEEELNNFKEDITVICAPGFNAVPHIDGTNSEAFIVLNIEKKIIIIGGSMYSGEMKKSVFTMMNYLMPFENVLPMHCSANIDDNGNTALFFGLSGTGKTTLSADPNRNLIGDDEHGWSEEGIFNFEGGCYAKCINLSYEREPQIWDAIRFGALLENVMVDDKKVPDYDKQDLTENTRVAYPVEYIPSSVLNGCGNHPNTIIFLTADAFGVLPPISKLTRNQAMYHFMSGYTSKLAGTERGIKEPEATFSACFGAPFMPMSPTYYAEMLGEKIDKHNADVFLVNTGWVGGPYGIGNRMKLSYTRAMVSAAVNGLLKEVEYEIHPIFNLAMPKSCDGVPSDVLNPINTWDDADEYNKLAKNLALAFNKNFEKFKDVKEAIKEAAPSIE